MSLLVVHVSGARFSLWWTNKFVFLKFHQGNEFFEETLTYRIFLQWTKNWQLCYLVVMVHIALQEKRAKKTKRTISIPEENYPPITNKQTRTWAIKSKNYSIYCIIVSTPHWLIQLIKKSFSFSLITFSVYSEATWFDQSPTTVLSGLSNLD